MTKFKFFVNSKWPKNIIFSFRIKKMQRPNRSKSAEYRMRPKEREALGYDKKRTFPPHWPYYFNCVYPGYHNSYYPETMRCKYAKMDVNLDLWKVMVPGRMHKTDYLPHLRWYYPYDNWLRYY